MKIPYIRLDKQNTTDEVRKAIVGVMASGRYIGGEEVEKFEDTLANYLGAKFVVAVGNGYDALRLTLEAYGIGAGDSVHTYRYTHKSTHAAIEAVGAKPVFESEPFNAVIPVHMNGAIMDILSDHTVIEDACQAIGARNEYDKCAGTLGDAGCFSFHPLKTLSCMGDGGAVATRHWWLAEKLRNLRNHGGAEGHGHNSRLDAIQAAILNAKLPQLDSYITARRRIAKRYDDGLQCRGKPQWRDHYFDTYSSYVLEAGPALLRHLHSRGIEAYSHIRTDRVSLPIYPEMPEEETQEVIRAVNEFHGSDNRA